MSDSDLKGDLKAMVKYKCYIADSADEYDLKPSLVAAIISRESNGGRTLDKEGYGFDGHGYGLMQVDDRWYKLRGGPYSAEHIDQGCKILRKKIKKVSEMHPSWTKQQKYQGGIAAYNCGEFGVTDPDNVDANTYQGNYSKDVLKRASFFRQNGY